MFIDGPYKEGYEHEGERDALTRHIVRNRCDGAYIHIKRNVVELVNDENSMFITIDELRSIYKQLGANCDNWNLQA